MVTSRQDQEQAVPGRVFKAGETFRIVERKIITLPLMQVLPDPDQPRKEFNEQKLQELAASIQAIGLQQPIIVRPAPDMAEYFRLIDGQRRVAAHQRLGRASIQAFVAEGHLDPGELLLTQLLLGLTAQRLNPFEVADGLQTLQKLRGLNQQTLSELTGISTPKISKIFTVNSDLAPALREDVEACRIPFSYSVSLARVKNVNAQMELAEKVKSGAMKRPALEAAVKRLLGQVPEKVKSIKLKTAKKTAIVFKTLDADAMLAELQSVVDAIRRAVKHNLPLESLPSLLK